MCTEFSQGNPSCQDIRSDGEMPFRLYTLIIYITHFFRKLLSLVSTFVSFIRQLIPYLSSPSRTPE